MGRTVPKGYRQSDERLGVDKRVVVYVPDVSQRQTEEKRRKNAVLLREILTAAVAAESAGTTDSSAKCTKSHAKS